jgi:choline dehydrogenase-like flavoprotein
MRKTEAFFTNDTDLEQRGLDGNVKIQGMTEKGRKFPMRQPLLDSWAALGISPVTDLDGNRGEPIGIAEAQESRNNGRRQPTSLVYPLDGVTVLTETLVAKVITGRDTKGELVARGVKLANGTEIHARETILTAGAYRTPQILMLSGIGPRDTLQKHGIEVVLDQPSVGKNLRDHPLIPTFWQIKNPSEGWARESGHPLWDGPQYDLGLDIDFITTLSLPKEGLARAIEEDEGVKPDPVTHPLLSQERAHVSHTVQYSGVSADGSVIMALTLLLATQATGEVTISTADIKEPPVINANFLGTAVDRYAMRESIRHDLELLTSNKTVVGREIVAGEANPSPLFVTSSDEEIDARIRQSTV